MIPAPPFVIRAALTVPLLAISGMCLKLVEIITPEVTR